MIEVNVKAGFGFHKVLWAHLSTMHFSIMKGLATYIENFEYFFVRRLLVFLWKAPLIT